MKYTFLFCLFFYCTSVFGQLSEADKNNSFIKIWGLLKYYHPEISDGKFDFDDEFLKEYQKLSEIKTAKEFDQAMIDWIKSFGRDKLATKVKNKPTDLFRENNNFAWINKTDFSNPLYVLLNELKNNTNYKDNYTKVKTLSSSIDFSQDTPLINFDPELKEHRLLFLASFWNKMKYWNVNIYLTDTAWDEVLKELLEDFSQQNVVNFEKAKEKLFSRLNDSHANYDYSYTLNSLKNFPSFGGRIVNDSLVITSIFDEKSFQKDGLAKDDVIHAVGNIPLHDYYTSKFEDVISASNSNYLRRAVENSFLFASTSDSIEVGILKTDGQNLKQYIQLKPLRYPAEKYIRLRPKKSADWKEIESNIGYINLGDIDKDGLKQAFNSFEDFAGIIIDLRNYPRNVNLSDLSNYLYPKKMEFLKILVSKKPSLSTYDPTIALHIIKNPFVIGKRNKDFFKGKVVLLVDRSTASQAEYIGMAIQASPNCITIGEQTFGAVMNRNEIPLTDGTTIDYTGVGAFYPDDQSVQRAGLNIDHYVKESAINYNSDLYLEKAIQLLMEK